MQRLVGKTTATGRVVALSISRFTSSISSHAAPEPLRDKCPSSIDSPDFNEAAFKGMQSHFPCLEELQQRSREVNRTVKGVYGEKITGFNVFTSQNQFKFKHGGLLPELKVAYEHWGELNEDKSNCVLLQTGLSASSHAKSHKVRVYWDYMYYFPVVMFDLTYSLYFIIYNI